MFAHIPVALGTQFLILLFAWLIGVGPVPALWLGAVAASAVCIMREVTQREYQWIEAHGGERAAMPPLAGLRFWEWNRHSKVETLLACGVSIAAAALATGLAY